MKTYREALRAKFSERVAMNSRYSLRALARDLALSPSYLSQVLNGSRGLTAKTATAVFQKLSFSESDQKIFGLEIKKEHSRTDKSKQLVQKMIDTALQEKLAHQLTPEMFDSMSNWFSLVLFQLFYLKDAPLNSRPKFIAYCEAKLGLPVPVIEHTIAVLLELQLIRVAGRGLEPHHTTVWTTNDIPSAGIRQFHRQMIDRAVQAIESQALEERTLLSYQLPILKSDAPHITRDLLKFGSLMLRKYGKAESRDGDTVYGLNFQLFRLSENA